MKRVAFMGTPDFSVPALRQLISSGYHVVAVYSQPDKRAGRGRQSSSPIVKRIAEENSIPVYQPQTLKDSLEVKRIASLNPDAIVVVAYGQIIPSEILAVPPSGCLNVHPSLLPRYRGASPVASAILAGEEETGVTIMLMDTGIDTGPMLAQKSISIDSEDTTASLEAKLAEAGARLLIEVLPVWFEQKIIPQRQDNRDAIYTEQISKKDGELNWDIPAEMLCRKIRAYYPWPGCYTRWKGKTLKVLKAITLPSSKDIEPGKVVILPDETDVPIGIATIDGIVGLEVLQMEGKKPMPVADFLRGRNEIVGEKLG